jgi:hypothetical protein
MFKSIGIELDYEQRLLLIADRAASHLSKSALELAKDYETLLPLSPRKQSEVSKSVPREDEVFWSSWGRI